MSTGIKRMSPAIAGAATDSRNFMQVTLPQPKLFVNWEAGMCDPEKQEQNCPKKRSVQARLCELFQIFYSFDERHKRKSSPVQKEKRASNHDKAGLEKGDDGTHCTLLGTTRWCIQATAAVPTATPKIKLPVRTEAASSAKKSVMLPTIKLMTAIVIRVFFTFILILIMLLIP